jgi:serine O-acetyltransferase
LGGGNILISSKEEYYEYLKADLEAHKEIKWNVLVRIKNPILHCQRILRKIEYISNCKKGLLWKLILMSLKMKYNKKCILMGFTIPPNVFGKGLRIAHYGSVVVNHKAKVGDNCTIHSGVTIGDSKGKVPEIGHDVYLGPGSSVFGGVKVGSNVTVGANTVVNKDFPNNVTIAGVPAKVIYYDESKSS